MLPALSVAEALVAAGHATDKIHYVGARRGIETSLVAASPFPHTFLEVVGLQRGLSRRDISVNLTMAPKMLAATRQATRLLRELRPRVVVSVGGYACLPAVFAARRLRVPIVVVSYDRRPGRATALTARFAAAAAVAFPDSPLPRAVLTGAPVRRRILDVDRGRDRDEARRTLALPTDRFVVLVTGGSLGSEALNAAIAAYVERHRHDSTLAVRQVVGDRFLASAPEDRDGADGVLHHVIGFDDRMELAYAAADLLVGRGARARSPRSPSPRRRRSSCRGPGRRRTTRRTTCAGCRSSRVRSCCPSESWRRSATSSTGSATTPSSSPPSARRRERPGESTGAMPSSISSSSPHSLHQTREARSLGPLCRACAPPLRHQWRLWISPSRCDSTSSAWVGPG